MVDGWASPYEAQFKAEVLSPGPPPQSGKRPPGGEYGDIPVSIWADWNVQAIRNAVMGHANGNFGPAGLLVEAMLADDRVQAATNGRIKGVTRCGPVFEPGEDPKREEVAEELTEIWPELVPDQELEQMLVWSTHLGFALCELVWEAREELGRWVPRIKPWHPLAIWYNVADRSYYAITTEGSIKVEPDDPKWLLFTPWGSYRGWLRGSVRSVAIPWIVRQFALRDMSRYSEKHGLPMLVAKVPAQAPAEDKARFFSSLRNLGSESNLLLPVQASANGTSGTSWDIDLLEAKDRSWQAFTELRAECDRAITLAVRGTNLTTEVDGGSYAASKTHQEEDADYAAADRKKLAQCLLKQLLRPYCLFNHGDANLAPKFQLVPPEGQLEPAEIAKVWTEAAAAVSSLEAGGWKVDRAQVGERLGLPLKPDQDEPEEEEDRPAIQLTPSDVATIVTVNEGRLSQGLERLKTPIGEDDPDGELTIAQFVAKREADPEQSAEERPPEEQARLDKEAAQQAAKFGLPPPPGANGGALSDKPVEPGMKPGEVAPAKEGEESPRAPRPKPKPRKLPGDKRGDEALFNQARAAVVLAEECQERQDGGKFGGSTGACEEDDDDGEEAADGGEAGTSEEGGSSEEEKSPRDAARKRYEAAIAEHEDIRGQAEQAAADYRKDTERANEVRIKGAEEARGLAAEAKTHAKDLDRKAEEAQDLALKAEYQKLAEQARSDAKDLTREAKREERMVERREKALDRMDKALAKGDLEAAGEAALEADEAKADLLETLVDSRANRVLYEDADEVAAARAGVEAVMEKARSDSGIGADEYRKATDRLEAVEQRRREAYDAHEAELAESWVGKVDAEQIGNLAEDYDRTATSAERARRGAALYDREQRVKAPEGDAEDKDGDGKTGDEEAEQAAEERKNE